MKMFVASLFVLGIFSGHVVAGSALLGRAVEAIRGTTPLQIEAARSVHSVAKQSSGFFFSGIMGSEMGALVALRELTADQVFLFDRIDIERIINLKDTLTDDRVDFLTNMTDSQVELTTDLGAYGYEKIAEYTDGEIDFIRGMTEEQSELLNKSILSYGKLLRELTDDDLKFVRGTEFTDNEFLLIRMSKGLQRITGEE